MARWLEASTFWSGCTTTGRALSSPMVFSFFLAAAAASNATACAQRGHDEQASSLAGAARWFIAAPRAARRRRGFRIGGARRWRAIQRRGCRLRALAGHGFELALRFLRRAGGCSRRRCGGAVVDGRQRESRLDLVRADALLLLHQFVARQAFEQAVLLLRDVGEARLRGVEPRTQRGDARRRSRRCCWAWSCAPSARGPSGSALRARPGPGPSRCGARSTRAP